MLNPAAVEGSVLPRHLRREVLGDWAVVEALDLQLQHREALVVHLGPLGAKFSNDILSINEKRTLSCNVAILHVKVEST